MNVILFGATGMVGQGVLRECLLDPEVQRVLSVSRSALGQQHEKLREILHRDFTDFSAIADQLTGYDACFFCLGVSSAGMKEADYTRVTYDFTMAAARVLVERNPAMTFIYVSGAGTSDSDTKGPMWARVKGRTEQALLRLSFRAAYMFRPAVIEPLHGVRSKTPVYQIFYDVLGPFLGIAKKLFPKYVTSTEQVGRAMLKVAREGAPKKILENADINKL